MGEPCGRENVLTLVVVADEFVGELGYWFAHEAFVNDGCEQAQHAQTLIIVDLMHLKLILVNFIVVNLILVDTCYIPSMLQYVPRSSWDSIGVNGTVGRAESESESKRALGSQLGSNKCKTQLHLF